MRTQLQAASVQQQPKESKKWSRAASHKAQKNDKKRTLTTWEEIKKQLKSEEAFDWGLNRSHFAR